AGWASPLAADAENRLLLSGEARDRAVFRGCGRAHRHATGAEPAVSFAHCGRERGVVTQRLAAQPPIGGAREAKSWRHRQPCAGQQSKAQSFAAHGLDVLAADVFKASDVVHPVQYTQPAAVWSALEPGLFPAIPVC